MENAVITHMQFGKFAGQEIRSLPTPYIRWLLTCKDPVIKASAQHALDSLHGLNEDVVFTFPGGHHGKRLKHVPVPYLIWFLTKCDKNPVAEGGFSLKGYVLKYLNINHGTKFDEDKLY